jgi:tetratricopeptide (TPR) repeat protein
LHEGDHDKALEVCGERYALAQEANDYAAMAGDRNLMGDILLEAGRLDEAAGSYAQSIEDIEQATVADDVKENVRRNIHFDEARVALARGDIEGAKTIAEAYGELVAAKQIPFEVRQVHELRGMIALAEGSHADAVPHLELANQQNPRVLFLLAKAHHASGNADDARTYCEHAADFNALSGTYAYVRADAQKMLAAL